MLEVAEPDYAPGVSVRPKLRAPYQHLGASENGFVYAAVWILERHSDLHAESIGEPPVGREDAVVWLSESGRADTAAKGTEEARNPFAADPLGSRRHVLNKARAIPTTITRNQTMVTYAAAEP
jgi:hypothetical protein